MKEVGLLALGVLWACLIYSSKILVRGEECLVFEVKVDVLIEDAVFVGLAVDSDFVAGAGV